MLERVTVQEQTIWTLVDTQLLLSRIVWAKPFVCDESEHVCRSRCAQMLWPWDTGLNLSLVVTAVSMPISDIVMQ